MAYVQRLILLLVLGLPSVASAYDYWTRQSGDTETKYGTPELACQAAITGNYEFVDAIFLSGHAANSKTCRQRNTISNSISSAGDVLGFFCGGGLAFVDGACGMPDCAGNAERNAEGLCCAPDGTMEGDASNALVSIGDSLSSNLACLGGCQWAGGGVVPKVCANGKCYVFGPFRSTGKYCTGEGVGGGEVEEAPDDDAKCVSKGQCPGTVNGQTVCVPCSSKSTEEDTVEETTGDDGEGGTTPKTTKTTKSVSCEGGMCTETTTKTTTVGGEGGEVTTDSVEVTKPQTTYCAENPSAAVCREEEEGSSWGGACTSGFSCDGDAVQCAQAQAAWQIACDSKVDKTDPSYAAGQAAVTGGDRPTDHPANNPDEFTVDLQGMVGQMGGVGPASGSCITDKTVTFSGKSYVLPFSSWCPYLEFLGAAWVAACWIMAAFIVFKD